MQYIHKVVILIVAFFLIKGCASYQDHYTLTETITTKVMVDNLLSQAHEPYANHENQINQLKQQLQKMQLYENTKKKNTIMKQMWKLLNSESSSLQLFLSTWKNQGTMNPAFIEEYKQQIIPIIDLMVDFESRKEKKTENALLQLLSTN